jgi:hypothetical protein
VVGWQQLSCILSTAGGYMDQPKKRNLSILQYLVTLILIALLLREVQFSEVIGVLKSMDVYLLLASVLIMVVNKLVATIRWKDLLKAVNLNLPLLKLYELNLHSIILNTIFPSTVGGDTYRVVQLIREQKSGRMALAIATTLDRALGIVALLFLTFATVAFNQFIGPQIAATFFVASGIAVVASMLLLWGQGSRFIKAILKFSRNEWITAKLAQSIKILEIYQNRKRALVYALALSILFQIGSIYNQFVLFQAIRVDIPFILLLFAIPITALITTIPISLGGLGLREVSLLSILAVVGVDNATVVSYSLAGYLSKLLLGLALLGYNFLWKPLRGRIKASSSSSSGEAVGPEKEALYLGDD